ncbi:MAG: hypothetical protein H7Y32_18220 [Chloroflexales bacterium]|nr:hypothetical protein [Chloroflexales bacterium]
MDGMGIAPLAFAFQLINLLLILLLLVGFFVIVGALRSIASSLRSIASSLHALADKQPPPRA